MSKLKRFFLLMIVTGLFSCQNNVPVDHSLLGGPWHCEEFQSLGGTRTYLVQIDRIKSDTTEYFISNFYNVDTNDGLKVTLKGYKLTFAQQQVGNSKYVLKSGSGSVNAGFTRMDLTYQIYDGQSDINVNAIFTRP